MKHQETNKMNNDVIIREATEKDIPKIVELYETESNLPVNQDVLEWVYFNRKEYGTCLVIAEKNGRIIGSQGLIPIRMIGNKRVFLSAKSESTLISKQYRGQGIFEEMYSKIFEIAAQRGIIIIWGFTKATKAFVKLDFTLPVRLSLGYISLDITKSFKFFLEKLKKYHGNTSYLVALPLMIYLLIKRLHLSAWLIYSGMKYHSHSKKVRELSKADSEFNELLSMMNGQHQKNRVITINKDMSYMNWRIFDNPFIDYKISMYSDNEAKGFIIYYVRNGILVITDYYCTLDRVFPMLLSRALRHGLISKCWCVRFFDKESKENQKYRKYFKFYSYMQFKNMIPMVLKTIGDSLVGGEQEIEKWFITEIFTQGI
ncbi:MAG: GNAT family N-acetyltransferase [Clostridiales bacterium]|jgi:L-amino acid N-acyltransferase YncA|nr:GNAT family N-acetyltransferase [Clostridiales bacterium]